MDIYLGDAEKIDHALSAVTDYMTLDDMILDEMTSNKEDIPLRAAIGLDVSSCPMAKDRKATRLGLQGSGGCPPSARNSHCWPGNFENNSKTWISSELRSSVMNFLEKTHRYKILTKSLEKFSIKKKCDTHPIINCLLIYII